MKCEGMKTKGVLIQYNAIFNKKLETKIIIKNKQSSEVVGNNEAISYQIRCDILSRVLLSRHLNFK